MKRYLAAFILASTALCGLVTAQSEPHASFVAERAQAQTQAGSFTAVVKPDEARFTLPVPQAREWKWRLPETRDNAREYRMDVSVKNGGSEYTFGFYLWKFADARPGHGSFSELLAAGQKSVFERNASTGHFLIIRDAGVNVSEKKDTLVITISGRKNVARLFSDKPSQVTFNIEAPGAASSKTVPVDYRN